MIEADLAELVHQHGGAGQRRLAQQMVQQRGLAGAEEAGQHGDRHGVSHAGAAIQVSGRNQRRGDLHQRAVAHGAEEAVAAAGVAGDALLVHQQQQRVAVAIDAQFLQMLHLAGASRPCATARSRLRLK